jgi:hypothetical protein
MAWISSRQGHGHECTCNHAATCWNFCCIVCAPAGAVLLTEKLWQAACVAVFACKWCRLCRVNHLMLSNAWETPGQATGSAMVMSVFLTRQQHIEISATLCVSQLGQ